MGNWLFNIWDSQPIFLWIEHSLITLFYNCGICMWNVGIMVFKTNGACCDTSKIFQGRTMAQPPQKNWEPVLFQLACFPIFIYVEMLTQMNLNPQFSWMMGWWLVEEIMCFWSKMKTKISHRECFWSAISDHKIKSLDMIFTIKYLWIPKPSKMMGFRP